MSVEKNTTGSAYNLPVSASLAFTSDDLALIIGTCLEDGVFVVDCEKGLIVAGNQKFLALAGLNADFLETSELSCDGIVSPGDRAIFNTWQLSALEGEEGNVDIRILKKDGTALLVNATLKRLRWKRRSYLLCFFREIRLLGEREASLKRQIEEQKERAFEAIKSSLRLYQLNEKIRRTPLLAQRLLNVESEDQLFSEAAKVFTSEEGLNYRDASFFLLEEGNLNEVFSTKELKEKTYSLTADNRFAQFIRKGFKRDEGTDPEILLPLQSRGQLLGICEVVPYAREKVFFDESGIVSEWQKDVLQDMAGIIALLIDNLRLTRSIKRQSTIDSLTQTYNRHYFVGRVSAEVRRACRYSRPVSLIFVDVDQFKAINDQYGHLQGDQVLRELGALFVQSLRDVDVVCRYGGDEFVILLPETDSQMASKAAQKLLESAQGHSFRNLDNPEHGLSVTLSVGVSTLQPGENEDELLRTADAALYRAKKSGKNRLEVTPG